MRSQLPHAVIAPVFLTLGVLAVALAVLAFRSQRRFLSKAMRATGVVKSLTAERLEKTTFYFPVITFTTAAGVPVTAQSKTSISSSYPIGKTISFSTIPATPATSRSTHGPVGSWSPPRPSLRLCSLASAQRRFSPRASGLFRTVGASGTPQQPANSIGRCNKGLTGRLRE